MNNVLKYTLFGWLIYSILWLILVSQHIELPYAIIRVMNIILLQVLIFYLNLFYFIPKFLDNNKKQKFIVIILVVLFLATIIGGSIDMYFDHAHPLKFNQLHHPDYMFFVGRFFMAVMPIVISSLISRAITVRKQKEASLELENRMLEAETKALKAQINPHFLFNSLNNIYALSQIKSDKTPDAILQLSDILRYVTYDSNQDFVNLKDEIKTIESLILLQALKDEDQSNIHIDINSDSSEYKIAPLLLIPFVENCFKHANHHDKENGSVSINLKAENKKLHLTCKNTYLDADCIKDKTGGVGMENVKKRLSLLYPNKHKLTLKQDQKEYHVKLELDLC